MLRIALNGVSYKKRALDYCETCHHMINAKTTTTTTTTTTTNVGNL